MEVLILHQKRYYRVLLNLSYLLKTNNVYYFDEKKGYERELKYCQNQKSPFVDEMKGDQRLEHVVFRNGALFVEKSKTNSLEIKGGIVEVLENKVSALIEK